jgi:hypothetical protein
MQIDINKLQLDLLKWREARTKRGPIPSHIWDQAAELARRDGVTGVAKALKLNPTRLKARINRLEDGLVNKSKRISDLEIVKIGAPLSLPSLGSSSSQPVAELSSRGGSTIKLYDSCSAVFLKSLFTALEGGQ